MIRELRIRDEGGSPVAGKLVAIHGQKGEKFVGETDRNGLVSFEWLEDWIARVEVDGAVVKRDWSLGALFGSKRELELVLAGAAASEVAGQGGVARVLQLKYPDGQAVKRKEVVLLGRGEEIRAESDDDGRVRFHWAGDYIERIEVEQLAVKRDWSISGMFGPQRELFLEVPRLEALRLQDRDSLKQANSGYMDQGVRGRLYYADGTQVRESFKIAVSLAHDRQIYDSSQPRCYCRDDGEFFIATPAYAKGTAVSRMWIKGDQIPSSNWIHNEGSGSYVVLMPQGWRRGGGDAGGVIAGQVVNTDGSPALNRKVQGVVRSSGFLSFQSPQAETYTDSKGRFVLMFQGGIELKQFYVDGDEPLEVSIGGRRMSPHELKAGTFGLKVVRQSKLFG